MKQHNQNQQQQQNHHVPKVVCVKLASLRKHGYNSLQEWLEDPTHIYIDENKESYIKGARGSKWANPFKLSRCASRSDCVYRYETHVRNSSNLMTAIKNGELSLGVTEIGCFSAPFLCHGHVLQNLIVELTGAHNPYNNKNNNKISKQQSNATATSQTNNNNNDTNLYPSSSSPTTSTSPYHHAAAAASCNAKSLLTSSSASTTTQQQQQHQQHLVPLVVSLKKAALRERGYSSFDDWASVDGHVYVGRDMTKFIPKAKGSKWGNPFKPDQCGGLEACVERYENYVRMSPKLMESLRNGELSKGIKEIGCWCAPNLCHGHALQKLIMETTGAIPMCQAVGYEEKDM